MDDTPHDTFKRSLAAATRSLAAQPEVEVAFGGERPVVRGKRARIPNPPRKFTDPAVSIARGLADGAALKLAHHDETRHRELEPTGGDARAVFRALEDARCSAIGARSMKGVGDNLAAALERECEQKGYGRMEDRQDAPLADVAALMLRERMTGRPVPPSAMKLVDAWRETIEAKAGDSLDALARGVDDQDAFARLARDVLRDLDLADDLSDERGEDEEMNDDEEDGGGEDDQPTDRSDSDAGDDAPDDADPEQGDGAEDDVQMAEQDIDDVETDQAESEGESMQPVAIRPQFEGDSGESYKAYTTKYDEVVKAADLCDPEELERLRRTLDHQLESLHAVVSRLANKLQRKLLAQQKRAWAFDLDEGVLDAARLARVVVDPMQPLSFKQELDQEFRDTTVTLLLDNSGSMRGRPISIAATCADILARTLERCSVKVEILGFTTRAWKGGQSRED
ncbi:MAG: cobaltochelatase subunit CobT, partial [Pseudomonadota bacterium]